MTGGQPRWKGVGLSPGTKQSVVSPPSGIRVIIAEDVCLHNPCGEVTVESPAVSLQLRGLSILWSSSCKITKERAWVMVQLVEGSPNILNALARIPAFGE